MQEEGTVSSDSTVSDGEHHLYPTEKEFKLKVRKKNFQTVNPQEQYDILRKLGVGGFAKVYEVRRKTDN